MCLTVGIVFKGQGGSSSWIYLPGKQAEKNLMPSSTQRVSKKITEGIAKRFTRDSQIQFMKKGKKC